MMIRIIKNIPVFFLFLSALVLNAHLIIPHDHHPADSDARQENRCPVSDNGTRQHSRFPVHCHAFNDLTSEKVISYIIIKQGQFRVMMPGCLYDTAFSNMQLSWIRIFDLFTQSLNPEFLELSSLRAPPSIC